MDKLLIIGAGGLGRMTMEAASNQYQCYFVDDGFQVNDEICGIKVVGKIDDLKQLKDRFNNAIVAIGNNQFREKLSNSLIEYGYNLPNIFNSTAYISNFATFGYGCIVLSNASIQNGAKIGNGVVITANVEIHHDSKVNDYALIYSNSTIRTYAEIGKRVKIGSNVSISNSVIVADDSAIENGEVR